MLRSVSRRWIGRKLALVGGDAAIFAAALGLVSSIRHPLQFGPYLPFLPVLGFCLVAAYAAGLYELRRVRDFVDLVGGLLASTIGASVLGIGYFYLLQRHISIAPKATLLLLVLLTHVGMFAWRRLVLLATGFNLVDLRILMLGEKAYRDYLRQPTPARAGEEFALVEDLTDEVDLVVVDHRWTARHPEQARRALSTAIGRHIPVVSLGDFHESLFGTVLPQHATDLAWAVEHVLPRSGSIYFTFKRVLDVTVAIALLVLLLPTLILIAASIRLVDGASPLYGQRRAGFLGQTFRLWKFRTMREDAEHAGPFSEPSGDADPRVTSLGRLLRRLRLDELPQLWNVLKGEMSLVGPRPEWEKEAEILEQAIPTYRLRYLVPPGITGWAQVYFRATNSPEESFAKQNYDLYYLKHFSLALDFSIMLKTLKRIFVSDARLLSAPPPPSLDRRSSPEVWTDVASFVGRG